MSRKVLFIVLIAVLVVLAITGDVAYANGPGNGKGQGKAKGHVKQEEKAGNNGNSSNDSGSSESPSDSSDSSSVSVSSDDDSVSGPKGNGNTGSSKTRKGLDDTKQNQNIYQSGDTLSYHVSNRHSGLNTIIVKKPGKNGEIVFETTVMVGEDGVLNVVLTDIPEDWAGVYQVQIWDDKGMKNDNINIKRPHVANPEDLPSVDDSEEPVDDSEELVDDSEEPVEFVELVEEESKAADDKGDCITLVYHASDVSVTVVEFFRPEHSQEPWLHEDARLGESRVDTEGAVVAQFATGVTFVVFEYDEATGAYNYRGTGEVVGDYNELVHIWSDGDASSVLFNALVWTPVGAK